MKKNQGYNFNFLIIGSGIAGLNFALQVAKFGKVAIVTKKELMESNSNYAQGGIAAVLDKYDSFEKHIEDTLKAGCYLNDKKAVEIMIKQAPKEIKRLIKLGVGFSKTEEKLCLAKEGGHSMRRIAHAKDTTGKEIERALIHQVRHNKNISIFESHLAYELKVESRKLKVNDRRCIGALVLDIENNKIVPFFAKATIIATGGAGQVYLRNSNPKIATGDGIAMASEAGAEISDMEFFQFHPTALNKPNKPAFLLSEALRGEGALLVNKNGKRFMQKYHPLAELAPRDIVSRAIFNEAKKGPIFLDIRHKGSQFIKQRFPYIYNELWWYDIKMDKDLIPISPAAHFICGGIHTDLSGKTNIDGLFAFGESAHTGVHGANRLASNSLLECMVFSSRAVQAVKRYVKTKKQDTPTAVGTSPLGSATNFQILNTKYQILISHNPKPNTYNKIKKEIQTLMWENVGIVRETKKMTKTLKTLKLILEKVNGKLKKGISKDTLELKNLLIVAILITEGALTRKQSVGAHFLKK